MAVTGGNAVHDLLPFLTCRAGGIWFAVPAVEVERITETAEGLPVCPIPGAEVNANNKAAAYLVFASGETRVGFSIDEVGVINTFPATSFYSLPEYMKGQCHPALWGIGFIEGCAYFLLNLADIDVQIVTKPPLKEGIDV